MDWFCVGSVLTPRRGESPFRINNTLIRVYNFSTDTILFDDGFT